MHFSIVKFVVITLASAFGAAVAIFSDAFRSGKAPSDDGPRALIAEFLGLWICFFFMAWSFTLDSRSIQWTLRGIAVVAAMAGGGLSLYFANTTEVPETPDKDPTGFKDDTTGLHLE